MHIKYDAQKKHLLSLVVENMPPKALWILQVWIWALLESDETGQWFLWDQNSTMVFQAAIRQIFFCPSSKSSVNLSIFDYENVPCFPALQVHCQTFNISVFSLFSVHSNTFRTVWLVSPKSCASALPKMHFLLLCHC